MKDKLSCEQVIALLTFYVEDKLNPKLKETINTHLKLCADCRNVYMSAGINIFSDQSMFSRSCDLYDNLSAYIDNELNDIEAVKIRKLAITNPLARKDLENMLALKREMHSAFNKTKNDCRADYSKFVISEINGKQKPVNFNRLIWTFTAMMSVLVAGFIVMLYF